MKSRIAEHFIGIIVITVVMIGGLLFFEGRAAFEKRQQFASIKSFSSLPVKQINDPFERALIGDCLDLFYPGQHDSNQVVLGRIYRERQSELSATLSSSAAAAGKHFSLATLLSIAGMFPGFLLVYLIVMLLTYYGVQTLGALRFIIRQQTLYRDATVLPGVKEPLRPSLIIFNAFKILAYFILFSPAYVIAYSIRTEFNTDSTLFMIILGVISNGLLVMYTNKFYTFLVAESRKGYIENALVKNLRSRYSFSPHGIPLGAVFSLRKNFDGHIFDHIFKNARFQYLSTIKEQASFLITGLVIIEMALNIHGHLTYELLRQLLYKNYIPVIIIMLFIFYTVKFTEIITDMIVHRESQRYENR